MIKTLLVCLALLCTSAAHASPFDFFKSFDTQQTTTQHATGGGRPAGCPHRWCGCWLRLQYGLGKEYNLARNWVRAGTSAQKGCINCIAVMSSHVGRVIRYEKGNPVLISGNHGKKVGIGTYAAGRIIAYRHV